MFCLDDLEDVEPISERSMSFGVLDADVLGVHGQQEGANSSRRGRGAVGCASQKRNSQGLADEKRSSSGWFNAGAALENKMNRIQSFLGAACRCQPTFGGPRSPPALALRYFICAGLVEQ